MNEVAFWQAMTALVGLTMLCWAAASVVLGVKLDREVRSADARWRRAVSGLAHD